jgi:hypothetical protein
MYIHSFAFQWVPGTTEEQKQKAETEILALQGKIPGLLATYVGKNESPRGKGNTFGGVMLFKDRAAAEAYFPHPIHDELVAWLMPLIDPTELDFEAKYSTEEFKA